MKKRCSISLMVAVVALLMISVPVQASKMDDRIESSAKKSYIFKIYLKDDDIKIQSKDGAVIVHLLTMPFERDQSEIPEMNM